MRWLSGLCECAREAEADIRELLLDRRDRVLLGLPIFVQVDVVEAVLKRVRVERRHHTKRLLERSVLCADLFARVCRVGRRLSALACRSLGCCIAASIEFVVLEHAGDAFLEARLCPGAHILCAADLVILEERHHLDEQIDARLEVVRLRVLENGEARDIGARHLEQAEVSCGIDRARDTRWRAHELDELGRRATVEVDVISRLLGEDADDTVGGGEFGVKRRSIRDLHRWAEVEVMSCHAGAVEHSRLVGGKIRAHDLLV